MPRFVEDAVLSGTRRTDDGYLVASVQVARTGVQYYTGDEMGKPDVDVVAVYRPEDEVFSKVSLATYGHRPITDNHPGEHVNADNWKEYSVGNIGDDVARDGEHVRVPILLMDSDVINKVEGGKRELSMGYSCEIVWEDGVAPDGTKYQAKQTNLRMNHLAVVDRGRAGHECRIGDSDAGKPWGIAPTQATPRGKQTMSDELRKVVVDGLQVETTEAGAQAIQKLQNDNKALRTDAEDADKTHASDMAAKDKELAKKDAEIEKLKGQLVDGAALDKLVADRAQLVADAKKIAPDVDFSSMSDNDIRKAAVIALRGADSVADKAQAYIDAAFDIAVSDYSTEQEDGDGVRNALRQRDHQKPADNGQADYEKRLSDAWKGNGGEQ